LLSVVFITVISVTASPQRALNTVRTSQFDNPSPRKMAKDIPGPNKKSSSGNLFERSPKKSAVYSTTITGGKKLFVIFQ
jgi:hypothetical protein